MTEESEIEDAMYSRWDDMDDICTDDDTEGRTFLGPIGPRRSPGALPGPQPRFGENAKIAFSAHLMRAIDSPARWESAELFWGRSDHAGPLGPSRGPSLVLVKMQKLRFLRI